MRNQSQNLAIDVRAVNGDTMATQDKLDYLDFWNIRYLVIFLVAND